MQAGISGRYCTMTSWRANQCGHERSAASLPALSSPADGSTQVSESCEHQWRFIPLRVGLHRSGLPVSSVLKIPDRFPLVLVHGSIDNRRGIVQCRRRMLQVTSRTWEACLRRLLEVMLCTIYARRLIRVAHLLNSVRCCRDTNHWLLNGRTLTECPPPSA